MPQEDTYLTVRQAADALGCSPSTVRERFHSGELSGITGPQPQRPRIQIRADQNGRPLDAEMRPIGDGSMRSRVDVLEQRLHDLEAGERLDQRAERFRDAALLLRAVIERQQRASELQAAAVKELEAALADQSQIILTLLVGDADEVARTAPS